VRQVRFKHSRIAVAALFVVGAVGAGAVTAARADTVVVNTKACQGAGTVYFTITGGSWAWAVQGGGSCEEPVPFDPMNPSVGVPAGALETVSFSGGGSSQTLGLCQPVGSTDGLVNNLQLAVTVTYTNVAAGAVVTENQVWSAPVTTFPIATLFVQTADNGNIGLGTIFTHVFLQCGNAGTSPSAQFDWAETATPTAPPPPA
jgi:hypothetical protein